MGLNFSLGGHRVSQAARRWKAGSELGFLADLGNTAKQSYVMEGNEVGIFSLTWKHSKQSCIVVGGRKWGFSALGITSKQSGD
jgi:hypothetical protein